MNYFELFEIPIGFFPDLQVLKRKYHQLSFKFHPDFNTTVTGKDDADILEKSTEINEAYQTLSDDDKRFAYILKLLHALPEEGQASLPKEFLMEMLELNEELMNLQFDPNQVAQEKLLLKIQTIEDELLSNIKSDMISFEIATVNPEIVRKFTEFYLKKKYLLRLKQNLYTFASS